MKLTIANVVKLASVITMTPLASSANVVGFTSSFNSAYVAVRGIVPVDTTIYGVRFYSNDATTFPEVLLSSDSGRKRLPRMNLPLRHTIDVVARAGYVTVPFNAYRTTSNEVLWILIRFPGGKMITANGLGGGPGIGLTPDKQLFKQRSFYSVDGDIAEFTEAFDISLITEQIGMAATISNNQAGTYQTSESNSMQAQRLLRASRASRKVEFLRALSNTPTRGTTLIQFRLKRDGFVRISVFDVSGRRVRKLIQERFSAGSHAYQWNGRDDEGNKVAGGVYLLLLRAPNTILRQKVVLLH